MVFFNDLITLACDGVKGRTVKNRYMPARVSDRAASLEKACGFTLDR